MVCRVVEMWLRWLYLVMRCLGGQKPCAYLLIAQVAVSQLTEYHSTAREKTRGMHVHAGAWWRAGQVSARQRDHLTEQHPKAGHEPHPMHTGRREGSLFTTLLLHKNSNHSPERKTPSWMLEPKARTSVSRNISSQAEYRYELCLDSPRNISSRNYNVSSYIST